MVSNGKRQTKDAPNITQIVEDFSLRWRKPSWNTWKYTRKTTRRVALVLFDTLQVSSITIFCKRWVHNTLVPFVCMKLLWSWVLKTVSISCYIKPVLESASMQTKSFTHLNIAGITGTVIDRFSTSFFSPKFVFPWALQFQNSRIRTNKSCSSWV